MPPNVPTAQIARTAALAPDGLLACPQCDALYRHVPVAPGQTAACARCHHTLIRPRRFAGMQIIMLAATMLILMTGATVFPFLRIDAQGLANSVSLLDAALAFADGRLVLLTALTVALILLIPALRMALLIYVLGPIVFDRPPRARAREAFRLSEALRPWSMAEVFALGCAVSLVKVGDLAQIEFGPAFWMFAALVLVVLLQEALICTFSVWTALEARP